MALGVRGSNPIWSEIDLTGHLFDDTFYLYVLQNTIPYLPVTVYHDPDLSLPWTNPIQFLANGTLPVDIFFDSGVVYRLEFRKNNGVLPPSQNDALIYEVNDYIAGTGGSTPVDTIAFASSNQVTNPQFSLINFTSPFTISATNPDPIDIAPGWVLEVSGTGTAKITLVPLNNSNENPSNSPYALQLTLTGWNTDSVFLRQRFQQNGMLWANQYVSSTLTARLEGSPQNIIATLVDSNASVLATVLPLTAVNGSWNEFTGYGAIAATTNPDVPPAAYIDYKLAIPSNIDIYVTSFQLVVQDLPLEPNFEQDSIDRQIDHTFHYYKPQLEYKPIPSYTIGWDFPFNPSQALGSVIPSNSLGANKSRYIADQTIAFEEVSNTLNYTITSPNGLSIFTGASTQFAIIQYLTLTEARELLSQGLSVCLKGITNTGTLNGTVSLYWTTDSSLPNVSTGTNNSLVLSMTSGKAATFNGNWTEIARSSSLGTANFTLTNTYQILKLSGFNASLTSGSTTATYFAIVIGFNSMPSSQNAGIEFCTLQCGDIATAPAPLSYAQTLSALQYYYEKSYNIADIPATITEQNALLSYQEAEISGANVQLLTVPFNLNWKQIKRTSPSVNLYSPTTGLGDSVSAHVYTNGIVRQYGDISLSLNWSLSPTLTAIGTKNMYFVPSNGNGQIPTAYVSTVHPFGFITYHYIADARLGIV